LIKRKYGLKIKTTDLTSYWLEKTPKLKKIPGIKEFVWDIFKKPFIYQTARPIKSLLYYRSAQGHFMHNNKGMV